MDDEVDTAAASAEAVTPDIQCIGAATLGSAAVALDWTQSRDGVLTADAAGSVSMWQPCRSGDVLGAAQLQLLWQAQATAEQVSSKI